MSLTNADLRRYDANVLRLPAVTRGEYHRQVDRLIAALRKNLLSTSDIRVTRVVKAGSFAKYTILRKTNQDPVDVDLVFYICGKNVDDETLDSLNETIHRLLLAAYPSKSVEDFEIQRRAATVRFVGSGLSVDIVPVIEDPDEDGYGWQYDRDGSRNRTCAPCQIAFVRDRKARDADFRTLVRMAKRWRNRAGLKPLKSFTVELILAYLLDTEGADGSIEARFRRFLLYVAQSGLKDAISFPENVEAIPAFDDPVVVVDPVCSTNNVAARITEGERVSIVKAATEAWEIACHASEEDDMEIWKEIFGPRFDVEDAA